MTDIARLRRNVQIEEVAYKAAVSESTWNKIGGAINFINDRQTMVYEFGIFRGDSSNGTPTYNGVLTTPYNNLGTNETFLYAAQIIAVTLYHGDAGSSGTSELDIKWQPVNSATAYASIFSTTPKVASTAASNVFFDTLGNNTTPTGCTVPVLSKSTFAAGDKLRCDLISSMGGTPNGFLLKIFFRPI